MQEHERKDYERLRAEGRWPQASEFREAERQRLRAAGRSKQQANAESWAAMLVKFPPQGKIEPAHRQSAADGTESVSQLDEHVEDAKFAEELKQLAAMTQGKPTDADRDIEFAYRHMGLELTPLSAPSVPAWEWYMHSKRSPGKFLEVFAKREDAKSKAGGITEKRIADDKRKQFTLIDRVEAAMTQDTDSLIEELARQRPENLLHALQKVGWNVSAPQSQESARG